MNDARDATFKQNKILNKKDFFMKTKRNFSIGSQYSLLRYDRKKMVFTFLI